MMSSLLDDITLFSFKKRRVCLREKEKIKTKSLDVIKTFCKQEGLDENVLGQCNQLERTIRNSRAKKKAESGKTNPTITTFFQSVPKEK